MRIDTATIRDFLAALDKWLQALGRGDRRDADFYAREVAQRGRIVAVDPAFERLFEQHRGACRPDFDPAGTIECVAAFVRAVSSLQQERAAAPMGNGHTNGHPHTNGSAA